MSGHPCEGSMYFRLESELHWYVLVPCCLEAGENLVVVSSIPQLYLFFLSIKSVTSQQSLKYHCRTKNIRQDNEKGLAYFDIMGNLSFYPFHHSGRLSSAPNPQHKS